MLRPVKTFNSGDGKQIGAYPLYIRTHGYQHLAKLLYIRLTSRVVYGRNALRESRGHHDVCRSRNRGFIKKHIATAHASAGRKTVSMLVRIIRALGPELHKAVNVRIHTAAADLVSARLREISLSETGQQRSDNHYRAS